MAKLKIKYANGLEEEIENANSVLDLGAGEICYFIGGGFTRYHATDVVEHRVTEE